MTTLQILTAVLSIPGVVWALKLVVKKVSAKIFSGLSEVDYLREQLAQREGKCEKCRRLQQVREDKIRDLQNQVQSYEQLDEALGRTEDNTQPGFPSSKRKATK